MRELGTFKPLPPLHPHIRPSECARHAICPSHRLSTSVRRWLFKLPVWQTQQLNPACFLLRRRLRMKAPRRWKPWHSTSSGREQKHLSGVLGKHGVIMASVLSGPPSPAASYRCGYRCLCGTDRPQTHTETSCPQQWGKPRCARERACKYRIAGMVVELWVADVRRFNTSRVSMTVFFLQNKSDISNILLTVDVCGCFYWMAWSVWAASC